MVSLRCPPTIGSSFRLLLHYLVLLYRLLVHNLVVLGRYINSLVVHVLGWPRLRIINKDILDRLLVHLFLLLWLLVLDIVRLIVIYIFVLDWLLMMLWDMLGLVDWLFVVLGILDWLLVGLVGFVSYWLVSGGDILSLRAAVYNFW